MNNKAKITLVGAGPGDTDLITVKGLKALQSADVVLYDALTNKNLLKEAPNAIKIYVGKRANKHRYSQDEINLLLVQNAFNYGHVVRLKGGDPFIFGRGHEELMYAEAFGIPVEIVPGLSSSTALAGLQQVPLTRRGVNHSFWVMTGTTSSGELADDVKLAAQSSATIVVLMGIKKLPQIVELFKQQERSQTPVIIIQNGSLPNEKIALGTIETIEKEAKRQKVGTPGIIVIGEVVGLHPKMALEYVEQLEQRIV